MGAPPPGAIAKVPLPMLPWCPVSVVAPAYPALIAMVGTPTDPANPPPPRAMSRPFQELPAGSPTHWRWHGKEAGW